jgi:hypothetical protein
MGKKKMKKPRVLISLVVFCWFSLAGTSFANDDLIQKLLKLPAPPPLNPFVKISISRDISFYDATKPPSDDAPIQDILDYWQYWGNVGESIYRPKPSDKVLERIKNEIRNNHSILLKYIELFKDEDNVEFVKEIYDEEMNSKKLEGWWRHEVRSWLVYNSRYFTSELFDLTQQKLAETETYVEGKEELKALARLDWEKANPIVQQLIADNTKPALRTLAKWVLYRRSIEIGDDQEADRLREELKKIATDKQQKAGVRDLALDALLMEKEFSGRDEWYFSLMNDETLLDLKSETASFTGLMTLIRISEPGKYKSKMLEFLRSDNETVRLVAARILLSDASQLDEKDIKALLPLLNDPNWTSTVNKETVEEAKRRLIQQLSDIRVPESVSGLISVLQEKLRNYNRLGENYGYVDQVHEIVRALGKQGDSRAIPWLLQVFYKAEDLWLKEVVLGALFRCGNFSIAEQVDAIEKKLIIETNNLLMEEDLLKLDPTTQIKVILGRSILQDSEYLSDELVFAILERVKVLKKRNPALADQMRRVLLEMRVPSVIPALLWELGEGSIDLRGILRLLIERKEIRRKHLDKVYSVRSRNSLAEGISACLLESGYKQILKGEQISSKAALLACARLIRASLPVKDVAALLKQENKILFDAAMKYLEAEDSPQARQIVLSFYPGQAKILGANPYFGDEMPEELENLIGELFESVLPYGSMILYVDNSSRKSLIKEETSLQKEVLERDDLLGIYAYKGNVVRIYRDKATFAWKRNRDFQVERILQPDELERIKRYITESRVDILPPFFEEWECEGDSCKSGYIVAELLMLGKNGGRRVFVVASEFIEEVRIFAELESIFRDFQKRPGKVRYALEDFVPSFEILYTDENLKVEGVWKKENDFRVLIKDESRMQEIKREIQKKLDLLEEKGRKGDEYNDEYDQILKLGVQQIDSAYSWRKYEDGKFRQVVTQPDGFDFSPCCLSLYDSESKEEWKRKTASFLLLVESDWLIKKDLYSGKEEKLIRVDACCSNPVLSADGNWVIVTVEGVVKRYNLRTRRLLGISQNKWEYPLPLTIAYVPALGKFLLGELDVSDYGNRGVVRDYLAETEPIDKFRYRFIREYYLLDAVTGNVQVVDKRVMPLAQQTWRPLQSFMGKTDEFWVANPDFQNRKTVIGIFNVRSFQFKPLMQLPKILFDSMDMWVDEQERKVYITHSGNLLRVTLP